MNTSTLRFRDTQRDFSATLNKRVNTYFREHNINKYANTEMIIKSVVMFGLYFLPYTLIVTSAVSNILALSALVVIMGLGLAGIGLSVMHDANHGAYSKTKWINSLIAYSLNLVGASSFNWKIQHNVLHHTYTNVHDEDEDIRPRVLLRLSPHSSWKSIHRYQFIYAWALYGLMTIVWIFINDFVRLYNYQCNGLAKRNTNSLFREWSILLLTKLCLVGYTFVIPLAFTQILWWQIIIGIFIMHYVAGFILAIIFQPAHVAEGTMFPQPDDTNTLENNWAIHQLHTTTNFGNKSKWFSWYVGGLNFQIEHHLFPNICHVHYRKIAAIVRKTAEEFDAPYKSSATFIGALISHARLLKSLGQKPVTLQ